DGMSILQACEEAGCEIPRFCYHERLSVAGNCRMCLVEVENMPKPIASCALPVAENMVVHTKTEKVQDARKGVMEFLLINHPLDCPICDQGGECDLQDQAMAYGVDGSRFAENKRAVEDKEMGPLIKTIMTRCIHCTRCVRFATEIAGVPEIGAIGRGEDMEITTYLKASVSSELSGNVIDLCPVGALTSKPYAFEARPWELRKVNSVDVMDAMGCNIRIDARDEKVMRILPRLNEEINEEWISDKTRFVWDGLATQRLDRPYIRKNNKLKAASWKEALEALAKKIKETPAKAIGAIAGDMACVESMMACKDLLNALGSTNMDCRQDGANIPTERGAYLFNSGFAGIEKADAILLIGANIRSLAPVLNARIRKHWLETGLPIASIGVSDELTYATENLGEETAILKKLASGKHGFCKKLKKAKNPMIIFGSSLLRRSDANAIYGAALEIAHRHGLFHEGWNGWNMLHHGASLVGGMDIGFLPQNKGKASAMPKEKMELLFLLGADELNMEKLKKTFIVYIGSHGDRGAHGADIILPACAYTEKSALWVNMEGRVQMGECVVAPPGEAKEDWRIFRALSDMLGCGLVYNNLAELRQYIVNAFPHFAEMDCLGKPEEIPQVKKSGALLKKPLAEKQNPFYLSNPIARASSIMAQCAAEKGEGK
ncbi:MAG: NADH-quinone oxidoreductase subunit NuoG, partial [Parvibaculales bacterium]